MHPARSKLAPDRGSVKDLAVVFNNVPLLYIGARVNAALDGSGNLSVPPLVGIVLHMGFQPP